LKGGRRAEKDNETLFQVKEVFTVIIGKTPSTIKRETCALRVSQVKEIEIKSVNRKYETFRLKDKTREKSLLESIRGKGIEEPLLCAQDAEGKHILLDGFKRLRCCFRLCIPTISVVMLGADEADSILRLIHQSNSRMLDILEQAVFVNELKKEFKLKMSEIALRLERSPAWVSVRLGIFDEMSESIRQEVFSGRFPVRAYMYTLRRFTRVNKIGPEEADKFVKAVSGAGLSLRQIETLACGYFQGSDALKKQIEQGELSWTLKNLKYPELESHGNNPELTQDESRFVRDLESCGKYMQRLASCFDRKWNTSGCFGKTVKILAEGILSRLGGFEKELRRLHASG
jgi:hypothetical protein